MDHRAIIQQSLDYIEENLKAEITAGELAEQAGFSLFYFYRLFQSATGMPVMQYIQRRRLLHGVYAMGCGASKTGAALDFGFDTYPGFYKAFRREFGCTPSTFLKTCRAKRPCRIDLIKEEHMAVTHKKAARILAHWNMAQEAVTDIYYDGSGSRNSSAYYVGSSYVLKFTANPGKMRNNLALSKAIESAGLQAASPIPASNGQEYVQDGELYFYLTRRLPGRQLSPDALYERDARFVGTVIGQLHLALAGADACVNDADLLATVREWALPRAKEALGLNERFCTEYLTAFSALYPRLPRQIIHRDPNPGNIIGAGEKWGFIDFELSERNARIYDPCYAATAVLSENFGRDNQKWLEICHDILLGYDSVATLTGAEWAAVPYIILANQLVCVAWFADQPEHAELFETNRQMTRWLIGNFQQLKFDT